jgi:hypothetical protein
MASLHLLGGVKDQAKSLALSGLMTEHNQQI